MINPEANASIVKPEQTATRVTNEPITRSYASSNTKVTGDFQYGLCSCMDGKTFCRPVFETSSFSVFKIIN